MKRRYQRFIHHGAFAVAFLAGSVAMAQTNPYVVKGDIGKVEKPAESKYGPGTLEIDQWVGQQFILLPASSKARSGYQDFAPRLSYDDWVGNILTVTNVSKDGALTTVHFKSQDGTSVRAAAYSGSIHGIAPVRDLDYARRRWLGKSLWLLDDETVTYDERADKLGSVRLGRGAHVRVKNIVAGWDSSAPVRFILTSDDGRDGFLDVQLSGTNVSEVFRGGRFLFDSQFSERDPRIEHKN